MRRRKLNPTCALLAVGGVLGWGSVTRPPPVRAAAAGPIKHVAVIYRENHSFDETFGRALPHPPQAG